MGEEIEDDKEYVLGTIDMYTFGRYFPTLKRITKRVFNARVFKRYI